MTEWSKEPRKRKDSFNLIFILRAPTEQRAKGEEIKKIYSPPKRTLSGAFSAFFFALLAS